MSDRRVLARELLLEPFEEYRGWHSVNVEMPDPTTEPFRPWALHVVFMVGNGQDELSTPHSLSFVEIDHYHSENQLRNVIGLIRERIEREQHARIDEWEDARHPG